MVDHWLLHSHLLTSLSFLPFIFFYPPISSNPHTQSKYIDKQRRVLIRGIGFFCVVFNFEILIRGRLLNSELNMAAAVGMMGRCSSSWVQLKESKMKKSNEKGGSRNFCVSSSSSSAATDPYKTLRIQPGASESEVKKAFRQLALQYHPDVCRGSNCVVQFHRINEAYDTVMSNLRGETEPAMEAYQPYDAGIDEPLRGMNDPDWDMWEEWMGWEGAGIRDYSSHINPYI